MLLWRVFSYFQVSGHTSYLLFLISILTATTERNIPYTISVLWNLLKLAFAQDVPFENCPKCVSLLPSHVSGEMTNLIIPPVWPWLASQLWLRGHVPCTRGTLCPLLAAGRGGWSALHWTRTVSPLTPCAQCKALLAGGRSLRPCLLLLPQDLSSLAK